ncbi:MAG: hypothetical protein NVSMB62_23680 [Acidobacteriaceae bacterium]
MSTHTPAPICPSGSRRRYSPALLGLPVLLWMAGCEQHAATSHTGTLAPPPPPISSLRSVSAPPPVDAGYRRQVEAAVATQLHLTRAAVTSQLRAAPGSTLMNLAKPLGIAEDQLALAIRDDLNHAADAAVQSGTWTSRQAEAEKRFWASQPPGSLITEISAWYLQT